MAIEPDGVGKRKRREIEGEHFYFTCTRGEDGWIHFTATVPYENRDENRKIRAAVDLTCKTLTAMINAELGNVGRPKKADGILEQHVGRNDGNNIVQTQWG